MNKFLYHILRIAFFLVVFLNAKAQDTVEVSPPVEMPSVGVMDSSVYETPISKTYSFKEASDAKIDTRTIPQSDLQKVKSDEEYWYVNEAPQRAKKNREPKKSVDIFDLSWFRVLFWVLVIGGFVALLIWFLATSNIRLFSRRSKEVGGEETIEEATENIFELNFGKEIQKAIGSQNYRMAVRLMYLRTLRDLSLKNLINYTHEKTNSDYLFQLAGTSYYKNFFRLTRDFDYTWYGHFPLSQDSFSVIQNDFNNVKQQLSA